MLYNICGEEMQYVNKEEIIKLECIDQIKDKVPYYNPDNEEEDPNVKVRLIGTTLPWEWYIFDYQGDGIFTALVKGYEVESGSVSFDNLLTAHCYIDTSFKEEKLSVMFDKLFHGGQD